MTDENNSQSQSEPIDFGEDNTFQGPVAGGDQENYDLQGAQGPVVIKPQGPVTQIWNQYQNLHLTRGFRLLLVGVATVVVGTMLFIILVMAPTAMQPPTPAPTPIKMTGTFKIMVAEFGEQNCQGDIDHENHEPGKGLSGWLASMLRQELAKVDPDIKVWDDQDMRRIGNPPIGIVEEETRGQKQRSTFGAHMLIYGTLDCDKDPAALQLNSVWVSELQNEPDLMIGNQKLGQPVPIEHARDAFYLELVGDDHPLWRRVKIVTWLSRSLFKDLADQHEQARDLLTQAGAEMGDWQAGEGKPVIDYFLGREYLALHKLKEAEERFVAAKDADPDYVNAYIGLGNVYLQRVNSRFLQPSSSSGEDNMCSSWMPSAEELAATADQSPITASQVLSDANQAIVYYQHADNKASSSTWEPMKTVTKYMLGRGYRVKGEAVLLLDSANSIQASADLIKATGLISPTLQQFEDDKLYGFLAYAYFDLASAQRATGYIYQQQAQKELACAAFVSAASNYGLCIAQYELHRRDRDDPTGTSMLKAAACFCKLQQEEFEKGISECRSG